MNTLEVLMQGYGIVKSCVHFRNEVATPMDALHESPVASG